MSEPGSSVFERLKAARRSGRGFVPAPVPRVLPEQAMSGAGTPTYESLFDFSRRTGIPSQVLAALVESGEITHIRLESAGTFVRVGKALADLERLERGGDSKRVVA